MLDNFAVVLVNPDDGGNVGAVCRAMKTMGITDLVIIGGERLDRSRIETLAVHAFDIFENHKKYSTLEEALSNSVLSAGITRRRGRFRKYFSLLPEEFAATAFAGGHVSLVFGNEEHGLKDDELSCCDVAVHIPSSNLFPSLNLSHAVQIVTYALYREAIPAKSHKPVKREELSSTTKHITSCLKDIGFFTLTGEEEMARFFRDIFARASLSQKEAERIKIIFSKIADLKRYRG